MSRSSGLGHGLLPGVGVQRAGAAVRGARGARCPLLQVLQRTASLQRQVVQERQGVLQVSIVIFDSYKTIIDGTQSLK